MAQNAPSQSAVAPLQAQQAPKQINGVSLTLFLASLALAQNTNGGGQMEA